jgi:hypothetical protein
VFVQLDLRNRVGLTAFQDVFNIVSWYVCTMFAWRLQPAAASHVQQLRNKLARSNDQLTMSELLQVQLKELCLTSIALPGAQHISADSVGCSSSVALMWWLM